MQLCKARIFCNSNDFHLRWFKVIFFISCNKHEQITEKYIKLILEGVIPRVFVAAWVNYMGQHTCNYHTSGACCQDNLIHFIYKVLHLFDRPIVYLIDPNLWLNSFRQYWCTYMWYQSSYIIILYKVIRECWQSHGNGAVPGSSNSIEGKNYL